MVATDCRDCGQDISEYSNTCPNCGAAIKTWPLTIFTRVYFIGGLTFVILYAVLSQSARAGYLAGVWLSVGFALGLIVYGRAHRRSSDVANLMNLLGIALMISLLIAGIFRILI